MGHYYGRPGDESRHTMLELPYPMRLAWDRSTVIRRATCNRACADAMRACLEALLTHYSLEGLVAHHLDLYGGIYSLRRTRLGAGWSVHAYAAAIDLDPAGNCQGLPWPDRARMPVAAVELFEGHHAVAGARWRGRYCDAMHFQFAT